MGATQVVKVLQLATTAHPGATIRELEVRPSKDDL